MKKVALILTIMFVGASLSFGALTVLQKDLLSTVIWTQTVGDKEFAYHNKAIAISPKDSSLFIAGEYRTSGKGIPTVFEGIWIWKINDSGEKVADYRFKNIPDKEPKYMDIDAMAITDNNDVLLVIRTNTDQAVLNKISHEGNTLFSNKLGIGRRIFKIISSADGKFFFIGAQSLDSLIMKINPSGEVLWSKTFDRGQTEMFMDGQPTEDGGFILVENSGKTEKYFMSTSDIWITKYDSSGQKIFEKSFPGRWGSIAKNKNGGYVIIYDKSTGAGQNIWAKAFDKNLSVLWETSITETQFGLERFKMSSLTNGDFVVIGTISGKPWISYISSTGEKIWDFTGKTMEMGMGTDVAVKDSNCFIVTSIIAVNEQFKLLNKIRVIKFQPE